MRARIETADQVGRHRHRTVGAGEGEQLVQAVEAAFEQLHVAAIEFGAVGGHRLQQRFDAVAEVADRIDSGHARAAFERMQVALQAGERVAVLRRRAQFGDQAVAMVEQVLAFLDEDIDQLAVEVGEVQRAEIDGGQFDGVGRGGVVRGGLGERRRVGNVGGRVLRVAARGVGRRVGLRVCGLLGIRVRRVRGVARMFGVVRGDVGNVAGLRFVGGRRMGRRRFGRCRVEAGVALVPGVVRWRVDRVGRMPLLEVSCCAERCVRIGIGRFGFGFGMRAVFGVRRRYVIVRVDRVDCCGVGRMRFDVGLRGVGSDVVVNGIMLRLRCGLRVVVRVRGGVGMHRRVVRHGQQFGIVVRRDRLAAVPLRGRRHRLGVECIAVRIARLVLLVLVVRVPLRCFLVAVLMRFAVRGAIDGGRILLLRCEQLFRWRRQFAVGGRTFIGQRRVDGQFVELAVLGQQCLRVGVDRGGRAAAVGRRRNGRTRLFCSVIVLREVGAGAGVFRVERHAAAVRRRRRRGGVGSGVAWHQHVSVVGKRRRRRIARLRRGCIGIGVLGDMRRVGMLGIRAGRVEMPGVAQVRRQVVGCGEFDRLQQLRVQRGIGLRVRPLCVVFFVFFVRERGPLQVRQRGDQRLQALRQRGERRDHRRRRLQFLDGGSDGLRGIVERAHAVGAGHHGGGQQAFDVALRRAGDLGDFRHIGHRERTAHRVHRAQQRLGGRLRRMLQPVADRLQMGADLGFEDLAQHAVHRRRRAGARRGPGNGGCGGEIVGVLAGGDAVGDRLDRVQVGVDDAMPAQRGVELRQHLVGQFDHGHHRRAGRAGAVEHAIEHALDLPAELAEHARADQAAAALERVEHAADRAQAFQLVRRGAPRRQQVAEVDQFLVEFLEKHLANVGVDVAVVVDEAAVGDDDGRGRFDVFACIGGAGCVGRGRRSGDIELAGGGVEFGEERRRGGIQRDRLDAGLVHAGYPRFRCRGRLRPGQVDERTVFGACIDVGMLRLAGMRVRRLAGFALRRGHEHGIAQGKVDGGRVGFGGEVVVVVVVVGQGRRRIVPDDGVNLVGRGIGKGRRILQFHHQHIVVGGVGGRGGLGIDDAQGRVVVSGIGVAFGVFGGHRVETVVGRCRFVGRGRGGGVHGPERIAFQRQGVGRDLQRLGEGRPFFLFRGDGIETDRRRHDDERSFVARSADRRGGRVGGGIDALGSLGVRHDGGVFVQRPLRRLRRLARQRRRHAGGDRRIRDRCQIPGGRQRRRDHRARRCGDAVGRRGIWLGEQSRVGGAVRYHALRRRHSAGQRPVAQRFQAGAGDVEDFLAARAALAQRFQVVLQAGHRIGQRVQLAPAGHAALADQFGGDVAAHAFQVIGRLRQFQHAQCTGDLAEQARHLAQALVFPIGLDEGDEMLARGGEIGDRLVRQHFHRAPRLGGAGVVVDAGAGAEIGDLVVERGVHVQQCAGDIQQQALIGLALAGDDAAQRIALLHHHAAGHAQAHHSEGVGDAAQFVHLGLQRGHVAAGTQVQVERVLDPQQFFLDRGADGVQQFAVAAAEAAAGMVQFGLGGGAGVGRQREQRAFAQARLAARRADLIEQRQQHDRDVAMAVLQALQVVGQQHRAAHQRGAGLVAVGHLAVLHGDGQQFQFLGDHRRGVQLDHAQGALHLVQVAGAEAHATGVGRVLDEGFDLPAHLPQGLVQLRLDPAQRGMAHRIAQRAHRRASADGRAPRVASAAAVCWECSRYVMCAVLPPCSDPLTPAA